jgi:hypothetical protein
MRRHLRLGRVLAQGGREHLGEPHGGLRIVADGRRERAVDVAAVD